MDRPVPAVRLIVEDDRGWVLLLKRANTAYGSGEWCLPGGKVDYGKTVAETGTAELKEETSLDCVDMKFLFYQDSLPMAEGKMHCINLYFACRASGTIQLNDESSDYAWVDPADAGRRPVLFGGSAALDRYWSKAEGFGPPCGSCP